MHTCIVCTAVSLRRAAADSVRQTETARASWHQQQANYCSMVAAAPQTHPRDDSGVYYTFRFPSPTCCLTLLLRCLLFPFLPGMQPFHSREYETRNDPGIPGNAFSGARFSKMHGLHVHCMCLDCPQMIRRNNGHLITLQIWIPWRYHIWRVTHEVILKPLSKAPNSFWIECWTRKDMGQFSSGPSNKSFRNSLTEYTKSDGRHFEHFSLLKKVCTYPVFVITLTVDSFWHITPARFPLLKAVQFVNSVDNVDHICD